MTGERPTEADRTGCDGLSARPPSPADRVGRRSAGTAIDAPPDLATDADQVLGAAFRTHYTGLVTLARMLVDRPPEAEEIVQEAFCRVYAGWDRLRDPSDPLPYLRTTVVNLCRSGLRRRRTQRRTPLHAVPAAPPADERALLTERQADIVAALRSLPGKQREVVALRYLLDCSTADTAAALGIAEGSVKSHLHRALAALEARLEGTR